MTENKWYVSNFEYREWDEGQSLLRSTLIIPHFIASTTKSVGIVVSEVFSSKEDAEEAYPNNKVGVLVIEEKTEEKKAEEGDIK
jgi:hypothetical protein